MSEPFNLANLDTEAVERINAETIEGGNAALDEAADSIDARAALERAAELSDFDYGRKRKDIAKEIGIPTHTLDQERKQLKKSQEQGISLPFARFDSWGSPVSGGSLIKGIIARLRRHVAFSDEAATAVAFWILFAWAHDAAVHSPILLVSSAEKNSGKSTLLGVVNFLVPRGISIVEATPAVLYRTVENYSPTLIVDEADVLFNQNDALRSIVNGSWTRSTGVLRCHPETNEVEYFSTFGPKAIGMKGKAIPDTMFSRSILIEMRRKLPGDKTENFESIDDDLFKTIRDMCSRWSDDNVDALRGANPVLPETFHNRLASNWRPLFAIAELIGDGWPDKLKAAAIKLTPVENDSLGVMLLSDIRMIFAEQRADKISTADLLSGLHAIEGRPWNEYGRQQKPITATKLAKLLAPYDIRPGSKRLGGDTFKGYGLDSFEDAFNRYLGGSEPSQRHNVDEMDVSPPIQNVTQFPDVTAKMSDKAPSINTCDAVTAREAEKGVVIDYPKAQEVICDHCGQSGAHILARRYRGFTANLHNECRDVWEEDRDTDLSAANGLLEGREGA